jgi:hypothetical protein
MSDFKAVMANVSGELQKPASFSVTSTGSTTARSLANRFAERVNVKDFGAVGSGTTNDQPAIQAAINAATAGAIIYFPEGTYFLGASTGLTVNKSLSFLGEKNSSTILLNKLVATGVNITGGSIFDFYNLKFVYNQGWYDSGTYASGGGNQHAILCIGGINQDGEIRLINCRFENITNCIWAGGFNILLVDNCEFIYQHGFAGCRWYTPVAPDIGHPAVSVLGAGNITKVTNCYFDGLVDPTFTGVQGDPPNKYRSPVDGIYKNGGSNPVYQEVSNCIVLNHGIEGILVEGSASNRSNFEDPSLNKSVTSLTAASSGDLAYPQLVTATVANHGYKIGETVLISGANGANSGEYNGLHVISFVDTNTFTYFTKSVPSSPATGTITANVNTVLRKTLVKDNYIVGSPLKSEYYAGVQSAIVPNDICGEFCEITGNTINGALSAISFPSNQKVPPNTSLFKPIIKNNNIENSLLGIFIKDGSQKGTIIENNTINTSSRFGKSQINDSRYSVAYCFHMPISFFSGEAIIRNNTIIQEDPLWDATLTVTSRNSGTNSFTVTDGTLVSDNLVPLDFNNVQDYGVLVAYTTNKIEVFPITSINGNDITVNSDFFNNQTAFSTGTIYWAKSKGDQWPRNAAIWIAGGANSNLSIENNKIINPQSDIVVGAGTGPVRCFGNVISDAKQYQTSGITRVGYEIRDNEILYFNQTGTAAPSSTPKFIGQLFVNTSANIIYMATGTSSSSDWKALATWNP